MDLLRRQAGKGVGGGGLAASGPNFAINSFLALKCASQLVSSQFHACRNLLTIEQIQDRIHECTETMNHAWFTGALTTLHKMGVAVGQFLRGAGNSVTTTFGARQGSGFVPAQ